MFVAPQVPVPIVPKVVILAVPAQVDKAVFSTRFNDNSLFNAAPVIVLTVLSAFALIYVIALGLANVIKLRPTVVAANPESFITVPVVLLNNAKLFTVEEVGPVTAPSIFP